MRLKISFYSEKKIIVPFGFTTYIQALIYSFLDRISSDWLHDSGFEYEKRRFKLFSYSSFLEHPEFLKDQKEFRFPNQVSFILTSPVDWVIEQVARNIVISEKIRIGKNNAIVSGVEIIPSEKVEATKIRINAVSPIEVHSTFKNEDGVKKTCYYSPTQKEFSQMINQNLRKKWTSFYKDDCPYNIKIEPVRFKFCKKQIRRFKETIIEGFTGHYYIEGEPDFLEFGISTGLGSRNSGGFGMVEVV